MTSRFLRFVLAAIIAAVPCLVRAHANPGYSHDSGPGNNYANPIWMSRLPDGRRLSELDIPGTHDSMAMSLDGGDIAQTQSMDLPTQLASGIRALDIRCRHINNRFAIYHGMVYQKKNFDDVLNDVIAFLKAYPGETVLMRVKEEYNAQGNTRGFDATFASYVAKHPDRFWKWTSNDPTLGEMRGKIVVLQDFTSATKYGIPWSSLNIQDDYNLGTNWNLESKWNEVQSQLMASSLGVRSPTIYVNFLSGSGGALPYFVASGHSSPGTSAPRLATGKTTLTSKDCCGMFPRVNCVGSLCTIAFEGTNVILFDELRKSRAHTGIVMADFPGWGLIDVVIRQN